MKIGRRLAAGYAVLFSIIALLCIISFQNMTDTDRCVDEITNVSVHEASLVGPQGRVR